jgi:spermidine/putrescine transport system permease protein
MRKMKKLISGVVAAAMALSMLTGCGGSSTKKTLKVYSWGEYIDTSLLSDFEKEYDCKVVYETFDSNETMYTKIQSGEQYDVLVPSDYMIERLIKEDMIQELDWSKLPNADGLNPDIMGLEYDADNAYSAPFFVGTVGILYDTTVVDEADLAEGWNILKNTKYANNIYMYDSERDSFMVALKALGYSMNTTDTDEIDEAYNWLIEQRDTMNPVYAGDDVIDNMISGNKAMAVVYSGDAAYIMSENENMGYFEPTQGTNEWCDAMVITSTCTEVDLAHAYINFMLDADSAYANSLEVGYTTPITEAADRLAAEEYAGINAYSPAFGGANNEVFRYQDTETKQYYSDMWTKVKAY